MKKKIPLVLLCLLGALTSFGAPPAETIYDNSFNFLSDYNSTPFESGDQIHLAGSNRVINDFAFEYFSKLTNFSSGNEQARVRFYLNDGPPTGTNAIPAPGTLLYDSGFFSIGTNIQTLEISALNIFIPSDTLTWTVQFAGLSSNELAGPLFYDPPQIGTSANFLWEKRTNGWVQVVHPSLTNNLSARFTALPAFQILSLNLTTNGATITSTASIGNFYSLEFKTNVTELVWIPAVAPAVLAQTNQVTLTDPDLAALHFRIYRIVERSTTNATSLLP